MAYLTDAELENRASKVQKEVLDKIDFLPYIKDANNKNIIRLMEAVEKDYDNTELTNNKFLEGDTFNWISVDEFLSYLLKRYPKNFDYYEVTEYRVVYNNFPTKETN